VQLGTPWIIHVFHLATRPSSPPGPPALRLVLSQHFIAETNSMCRKQSNVYKLTSWRNIDLPIDHSGMGCMDELFPTRCMVSPNEVEE